MQIYVYIRRRVSFIVLVYRYVYMQIYVYLRTRVCSIVPLFAPHLSWFLRLSLTCSGAADQEKQLNIKGIDFRNVFVAMPRQPNWYLCARVTPGFEMVWLAPMNVARLGPLAL